MNGHPPHLLRAGLAALILLSAASSLAEAPIAVADAYNLSEDTPMSRTALDGVMANDAPGSAASPAAGLVAAPLHGSVTLLPNGAFTFRPAANRHGADSFSYKIFGDRPITAFTIDEANSNIKVTATLRLVFNGVPSISSDITDSRVRGTIAAAVAPAAAPFSVAQITDFQGDLTQAINLELGVGCIPIINTCLAAVRFDAPANAIRLAMTTPTAVSTVRANGVFDTEGATFASSGQGNLQGTGELAGLLPATPLELNLPNLPVPFNGKLSVVGGQVRLEMQLNVTNRFALDATSSFSISLSGVIRAHAPLPLAPVEESAAAVASLVVEPVNDAPQPAVDSYLVRSGTLLEVSAAGAQVRQQLIPAGAGWKYKHDGADPGAAWKSWRYADAAWLSGAAELGYGDSNLLENRPEATNIRGAAAQVTAYFRKEFQVTEVNSTRSLTLELLRDDGAAVYLNGIEVARQNLAAGAGHTTKATSRIPNSDETKWFPETLPPGLLIEGKNVLAVEVHQFDTANFFSLGQVDQADVSFNLKLERQNGLTGVLANDTDVDSPAASLVASVMIPPASGVLTLEPDGAFQYRPNAGFVGADSFVYRLSDGTVDDAELWLIPAGAVWKYLDNGSDQASAWRQPGFADASWPSGAAEIGYGDDNTLDDRPETTKLTYVLTTPPVTTYFRKTFALPAPKSTLKSLRLRLLLDDGAAVYLNGVEIARENLLPNASFDDGALFPIEGEAEAAWAEIDVPPAGLAALRDGQPNTLAVELHQSLIVSNDASFDCELIALGTPAARVTLNVTADDIDGDLISDAWERAHGLDFAVSDAQADPDGDGVSNRMEFLADTDPLNRSQHLRLTSATRQGGELALRFPGSAQRLYRVQQSADLAAWQNAPGATIPGAGGETEGRVALPTGPAPKFYRVVVDYQFP